MVRGKKITLFLMDDTLSGRIKCSHNNWVVYRLPRVLLEQCREETTVEYLTKSGIYLLLGATDDPNKDFVYIGQANTRKGGEGILRRIKDRMSRKDEEKTKNWNEVIIFTSGTSFEPTELNYLENRLYNLAKATNRYVLENGNEPPRGYISEENESEAENIIENVLLLVGALGIKVFSSLDNQQKNISQSENPHETLKKTIKQPQKTTSDDVIYTLKQGKLSARGMFKDNGFMLLEGSQINKDISPNCQTGARNARTKHKAKIGKNGKLLEDIMFKSPNIAANFVVGHQISAPKAWKTEDGKPLGKTTQQKPHTQPKTPSSKRCIYTYKRGPISVMCEKTKEGYILLKGSKIKLSVTDSCPQSTKDERKTHKSKIGKDGSIKENILFTSLSKVAKFATGGSIDASKEWKLVDENPLKKDQPQKTPTPPKTLSPKRCIYTFERGVISIKCEQTNEGFLLLKDSKIKPSTAPSCPKVTRAERDKHQDKIAKDGTIKENILFPTLSKVAKFAMGCKIDISKAWKTTNL